MGNRIGIKRNHQSNAPGNVKRIAIFASGAGSNAQKIIDHFRDFEQIEVSLILYNKHSAGVKQIALNENIPAVLIEKDLFFNSNYYPDLLKKENINLLVLAGFLWKVPANLIDAFPRAIINIHPALLPAYGGKGMYGNKVHEAVLNNQEAFSGITIHYVNEHYDEGTIIFQAKCPVLPGDTPETLATRIHQLEHANYPVIIENLLKQSI